MIKNEEPKEEFAYLQRHDALDFHKWFQVHNGSPSEEREMTLWQIW